MWERKRWRGGNEQFNLLVGFEHFPIKEFYFYF